MEGQTFLSEYMQDYQDDYILIGGNACALQFEAIGATFRATEDLDIVLVTESTKPEFYAHLSDFLETYGYDGKRFNGSNQGGSAYRFTLPDTSRGKGLPVQIELFARKPEYFDEAQSTKLYITLIEAGAGISNFSAILLDDETYHFILSSRVVVNGVTTVNLPCLLGLKSVAWHNNQALKDAGENISDETIFKHPADMLRIVSVLEGDEVHYPASIYDALQQSRALLQDENVRAMIPLSGGMDIETTRDYIATFARQSPSA